MTETDSASPGWLSLCVSGPWIVILDLNRNRYSALPRRRIDLDGPVTRIDAELAVLLETHGLTEPIRRPVTWVDRLSFAFARRAGPALCAWLACAWAARAIKRARLAAAVGLLRSVKISPAVRAQASDAAHYFRVRPWYPNPQLCLFDSLALTFFLSAREKTADLVIGVKTGPFAAHAWVEGANGIINDDAEACAGYAQILRV